MPTEHNLFQHAILFSCNYFPPNMNFSKHGKVYHISDHFFSFLMAFRLMGKKVETRPCRLTCAPNGSLKECVAVRPTDKPTGQLERYETYTIIGKKVEVSLRLFDIFLRNMVFIFLWESFETQSTD